MPSEWNHPQCWDCWVSSHEKSSPDGTIPRPVRIVNLPEEELSRQCCYCDRHTIAGIYRRADPQKVPCGGKHE